MKTVLRIDLIHYLVKPKAEVYHFTGNAVFIQANK